MVSKCELAAPTAPVLTITSPRKKERGSRKAKVSPNNVYIYTTCKNLAPWSFLVSEEAGKHSSVLPEERWVLGKLPAVYALRNEIAFILDKSLLTFHCGPPAYHSSFLLLVPSLGHSLCTWLRVTFLSSPKMGMITYKMVINMVTWSKY
jgi:hypothetical protein